MTRQSSSPQIPFTLSEAGLGGLQGCHLGVPAVEMKVPCPPTPCDPPTQTKQTQPIRYFSVLLEAQLWSAQSQREQMNPIR